MYQLNVCKRRCHTVMWSPYTSPRWTGASLAVAYMLHPKLQIYRLFRLKPLVLKFQWNQQWCFLYIVGSWYSDVRFQWIRVHWSCESFCKTAEGYLNSIDLRLAVTWIFVWLSNLLAKPYQWTISGSTNIYSFSRIFNKFLTLMLWSHSIWVIQMPTLMLATV